LQRSKSRTKAFLAAVAAAMVIGALVASSAMAEVVPAKFSSSQIKVTTTGLTVKRNGLEPKACTFKGTTQGETLGELFYIFNNWEGDTRLQCPTVGTQLQMILSGEAHYDTVASKYTFSVQPYPSQTMTYSPWGIYWQDYEFSGTWVNGSGATASTVTFTNQRFGTTTGGQKLTIEGQVKATTPSGGLITLSH
jgi:hypothetical protein